jgi:ribosomal protein L3
MSHGNSKHHRKVGGIGPHLLDQHKGVPKGKKMSGHYGVEQVTGPQHRAREDRCRAATFCSCAARGPAHATG